ncbi:hypothetical protein R6L23_01055 [Streptomyces sp. SR27]|uniref:hypothetical protein n=1 Tax=Streptomyces sp. SR27 TaxID=3076630 RepID=UPI00295B6785|nr:hypothetical protein [Streptomyces sp. SR27]MDV9186835.1 hypothetical protein [Streptomyces sp. SR27]
MTEGVDYGPKIRRLESRTGEVESRASSAEDEIESLKRRIGYVDDLDFELRDIRDDARRIQGELDELDSDVRSDIADVEQAVKRLTGRIQLLEGHLLAAGGAPAADLDTVEPEWKHLAKAAATAAQTREGLLTDTQRTNHLSRIRAHESAVKERDEHQATVVEAARILSSTKRTSGVFKKAALEFNASRQIADSRAAQAAKTAAAAEAARTALVRDEAARAAKAPVLNAGDKAQRKLELVLRSRLADAIRDRALLPMWFVTVLGPVAPARRTQEWMELATQVMAYRVTYEVTDQALALGPKPVATGLRRTQWHQELAEALRRW